VMESDWLDRRFEEQRPRLRAVARRILGSTEDADDAVQEAWLRLRRADLATLENPAGWLTTVVARVCLDMLRTRSKRPGPGLPDNVTRLHREGPRGDDPEHEAVLADSVALALAVVMDTLSPAERVAFVLHDSFAVPFDAIGTILSCTTEAARQHASRARRRVQGAAGAGSDDGRHEAIVDAFLSAARNGDLRALVAALHRMRASSPTRSPSAPVRSASSARTLSHTCLRGGRRQQSSPRLTAVAV
jgi:RNA polymerase sigma factor (sigma-70 family)